MGFNIKGILKFILKGFKEHTLKTSDDHGYQRVRNLHITEAYLEPCQKIKNEDVRR